MSIKLAEKNWGVREHVYFQQTPMGDLTILTLEGNDPEAAFKRFGVGNDAFTKWFCAGIQMTILTIHSIGEMPNTAFRSEILRSICN